MQNDTRLAFNAFLDRQSQLNGVPSASEKFNVSPSVQQTLETKIQESSAFLQRINIVGVRELKGERLGLGVSGPIASRTNTERTERQTRSVETMDARDYECRKTDYDTHVKYALLDTWAKFPDFQTRLRNLIVQRQALDRMLIGFNGANAAPDTDLAANPLLQDVNIGWLQHIREEAPHRILNDGKQGSKIVVGGAAGDYKSLDGVVYDAFKSLLDPWYQEDPGLVVILGRELMHDKLFPLVDDPKDPTEILASDVVRAQKRVGKLPAITVPFFPPNSALVTRLDNLSIYWQQSARRRTIIDNPKRDRIENYESSNDAFVVEHYGLCALIENIEIADRE